MGSPEYKETPWHFSDSVSYSGEMMIKYENLGETGMGALLSGSAFFCEGQRVAYSSAKDRVVRPLGQKKTSTSRFHYGFHQLCSVLVYVTLRQGA